MFCRSDLAPTRFASMRPQAPKAGRVVGGRQGKHKPYLVDFLLLTSYSLSSQGYTQCGDIAHALAPTTCGLAPEVTLAWHDDCTSVIVAHWHPSCRGSGRHTGAECPMSYWPRTLNDRSVWCKYLNSLTVIHRMGETPIWGVVLDIIVPYLLIFSILVHY